MDITFILKKIFTIEAELKLFDHSIQDEYYWRQLRAVIFQIVVKEKNLFERAQEKRSGKFLSKILFGLRSSKSMLFKNPIMAKNKDILFHGHDRRIRQPDGLWWDLFCDPIIDNLPFSYLLWEGYNVDKHSTPAKTKKMYYLDFPAIYASLISKIKFRKINYTKSELDFLNTLQNRINEEFNCSINIQQLVTRIIIKKKTLRPVFTRMIKRINPKLVFVVVSYGQGAEIATEASRLLNIPVIELQHGTLSPYVLEYTYPPNLSYNKNFPNYFFTFGEYWNSLCSLPIPKDQIISVGYPFFEQQITLAQEKFPSKSNQILFISQGPIGKKLSKMAVDLASVEDLNFNIIYKLHPGEFKRWKEEYPWLKTDKITVIEDQIPIHHLFAQSKIQIAVYSMAIYEGIAFGLETIIVDLPGIGHVEHLIKNLKIQVASSAEELQSIVQSLENSEKIDKELLFKKNALQNIMGNITKIISKNE